MTREGTIVGHYKLIRLLGKGGMGEVYLAQDTRIARNIAIKVVRDEVSPYPRSNTQSDSVRLFEREMKAITALDHPNILPLYDFGEERIEGESLIYMVMPYRPEGSLADWLYRRQEPLSIRQIIVFIQQSASALQHAHNHNLIHLDVKLSNFLVRSREDMPDQPDLLLADFGISKFNTTTSTASQSIRGTPVYMAPEQWNGTSVSATDQYALAVMTYQLITGSSPFEGNMQQLMYKHLYMSPIPPSTIITNIPQAVDTVLLQALAKKSEDRFPSVTEYADAFVRAWQSPETSFTSTFLPASETLLPTVIASRSPVPKPVPLTLEGPGKLKALPQKTGKNWHFPTIIAASLVIGIGILVFLLSHSYFSSNAANTQVSSTLRNSVTVTVSPSSTLPATATFDAYPQLRSFYSGTASGYLNAYVTFTLTKEDAQGDVTMTTTFQQVSNPQKFARYSCLGNVTHDNHLHLDCKSTADIRYLLTIDAVIYSDSHMVGTEIATITDNSSYYHFYNWTAS